MPEIIKTTNLTKVYGKQKSVDNLNITVNEGDIYGFLGRNGAGKTTTIRMLLGLIKPTHGKIEIFGEDLHTNKKDILKRIGSIVEVPGFYGNLTAKENLEINARIVGIHKKNAIEEALEIVGLENETKKLVGKYSLGMKQRLGIARSLLHYPELLILDEPTNGLDPIGIKEMRRLIKTLAEERKITLLISSHILSEIEQLVDHLGIIHEGKLLEETEFDTLRKRNRKFLEFQVSNDNKAAMLLEKHFQIFDYEVHGDGIIRIFSHIGQQGAINKLLVQNDIEVFKILMSEDRLEDYFTKLVGGGTIG
ncbi:MULTISPECIES: ABC transporter ATP-binding protein [Bacillus]|uniref:Bacitracin ABC transporter, ATP-binding protein n=1 Tax=Bacillus amyloliquefaciens (strain Y2) TaxID=1155777 RepID=I2C2J4_BACAY|nr:MULTISPECIES: ABC transporter ATP-binding protein [Bacillus]AIW36679.1 bacitracin ABC transporter ATP-binding protein [Bacillus subtilis]ARM27040.1 bacitracin ABC transporter ATP-binding protein [Bacillus vallismortis]AFJ60868.1 bacitracin ABC transporter, ATP-binding protein [Bacillus velezensis YAU B9601-Y2]AHZ14786.1 spermidine/putrescine import ATP-binding protein potA [Bacillus velezensis SQR9]AIU80950.1 putative ABC transporter ATP-binding protein YxlF [Bacillus velezensis]